MIVFSAIVPHSPLLIPAIGKEHREKLAATLEAYAEIERQLVASHPDTLVVISPHAPMYPDAFSANMAETYTGGLKEFGDHGTTLTAKVDFLTLDHIHRAMRQEHIPLTLTSLEELDYGFTVPLLLLTPHLPKWKLVPLAPSLLDARRHFDYGRQLKNILHNESARIAVIASADLSHHTNAHAPDGVVPEGAQFDVLIREKLATGDTESLLTADPVVIEKAGQCGYKPIMILLGILDHMNATPKELAYEAPFGVGYLTELFTFA